MSFKEGDTIGVSKNISFLTIKNFVNFINPTRNGFVFFAKHSENKCYFITKQKENSFIIWEKLSLVCREKILLTERTIKCFTAGKPA